MERRKRFFDNRSGEKYLLAFLLGFGCLMLTLLPIMIAEHGYFIYAGDYNAQQINFYHTVNKAVRDGQFGWHWFTDLGSDLMTSYSFYLFGSPFFWLSTLLPAKAVTYSMPVLLSIKHGLASVTAYAYIRRFVRSKEAALIGGILYAFSGFQIYNIFFNHFQDATALFPLMLIAMEEAINNKRRGVFAVTVALMALINYYFFAGQAVFLVIYYLFRMRCEDFHTSWKKFAALAFEAVVGTMIAAVILLPSALDVMGNTRVSEMSYGADMVMYYDRTTIPRVIQSFFMPPDPPAYPILFYSDYSQWASIGGYFPLFSLVGVAAFIKTRRKHWATKLTFLCIVFAFIPVLNSMFQAMNSYYYARWFYMPLLIFAMMTAQSLDDENSDLSFGLRFSAVGLLVFAVIGILPTEGPNGEFLFLMLPEDTSYFWITVLVAALGLIACNFLLKRRKQHKSYKKPAIVLTLISSVICIYTMIFYDALNLKDANQYIEYNINGSSIVHENVSDDNFFRLDISEDYDNYPMYWDLPSMRAFQSTVNSSIMNFYHSIGVTRDVASRADLTHYTLRGLFSVKYYYRVLESSSKDYSVQLSQQADKEKNELVSELGLGVSLKNAFIPEYLPGFKYVETKGPFEIYQNELFIPMGFGYDSYITEKAADKMKPEQREAMLMDSLVLTPKQAAKYTDILSDHSDSKAPTKEDYMDLCLAKQNNCSSSFRYDSKGFESKITLDKPQLIFYSVPYSDGWTAEVNDKPADVEKVSYGFMAVRADAGENTITFRYKTPGLAAGALITGAGILLLVLYLVIMHFAAGDDSYPPHTHCYDYDSEEKPSAYRDYCKKLEIEREPVKKESFFTFRLK